MVCLRCGTQVRWQDDEPPANYDLDDGTAIHDSKKIVAWAKANPAVPPGSTA